MLAVSDQSLSAAVGRLLRTVREGHGMSQAMLARRAGASQQWLSKVERGTINPTLADLERFFEALGLRLRLEAVPAARELDEDPDLVRDLSDDQRAAVVGHYGFVLKRLSELPHVLGGRLAALAHGLPVRVTRSVAGVQRSPHTGQPARADAMADRRRVAVAGRACHRPSHAGRDPGRRA
jgi:transcriptional regulator with XRE-family HTH domain